jgi:hypothetical protein
VPGLSEIARAHRVPDEQRVAHYWPLRTRMGMRLSRHIPNRVVTAVAMAMRRHWPWQALTSAAPCGNSFEMRARRQIPEKNPQQR